jgi:hypothetical protein
MPKLVRVGRAVAVLGFAAFATQGCITHRNLATSAITFNKAVEEAQNQMLLLNALRASERRPMYITGISQVTGSVRTEVSAGLDIPFGKDGDKNSASPRATYSESPTFAVPVLDTQEFVTGFLNPLKPGFLAYYWDQGWPRSFLLHLLVQRMKIRVETPSGQGVRIEDYNFENYPDVQDESLCQFNKFGRIVKQYLSLDPELGGPRFETKITTRDLDPPLTRDQVGSLVMSANKDGYQIVPVKDNMYRLRVQQSDLTMVTGSLSSLWDLARKEKQKLCQDGGQQQETQVVVSERKAGDAEDEGKANKIMAESSAEVKPGEPKITVELFLRSPEGVLYYLGQLVRFETRHRRVPEICVQNRLQPIFVGRERGLDCLEGAVSVSYEGRRYLIPAKPGDGGPCDKDPEGGAPLACVAGRSMQALSLLNQLIALQKSAKDLPSSGVVRTIGQ